jgi:imidazolonepropionase-like amidohydrolase
MKRLQARVIVVLAIGVVILYSVPARSDQAPAPAAASGVTAITGASVLGAGGAAVPDAVIVLEGSRIARVGPRATTTVPSAATIVDARGKFVVPGLADMHNHLQSGSFRLQQNTGINLTVLLAYGVTTVFNPSISLANLAALKTTTASDTSPTPRVFGTGPIITVKGDQFGAGVDAPTPETPDEARATIARLAAAGVAGIKVSRDDLSWAAKQRMPLMKPDVLAALVNEAHARQLKVFAHAPMLARAKEVLQAGVDGLLHGIIDQPIDQPFLDLMQRNRAVYVPTLALFEDVGDVQAWAARQAAQVRGGALAPLADSFREPAFAQQFTVFLDNTAFTKSHLATARGNLTRVSAAGIPIVMGTDTGFFGVMMGAASHLELSLMVEAGLTPRAALDAATINAARMLGHEKDAGSIDAGKQADLVILDANPLDDIRNISRISRVVKGGIVYEPAQLLSNVRFTAGRGGRGW